MNRICNNFLRQVTAYATHTSGNFAPAAAAAVHHQRLQWGQRTYSTDKPEALDKGTLDKLVRTNKVVVFMKGNPEQPRCGFSNAVVQIMRMHGVEYDAHDVLKDESLRQGIKDYTDWPTIPQVFINGEFVGGCDILLQMHQSGDLIEELKKAGIVSELLQAEQAKQAKETKKK